MASLPPLQYPYPSAPQPKPPEPPRRRGRALGLAVIPAVVGAVVALAVARFADDDGGTRTVTVVQASQESRPDAPSVVSPESPAAPGGPALSVQEIVRRATPGVVLVEQPRGIGTGFLIDADGHILTNAHVVDQASTVTVTYSDGTTDDAKVLAADRVIDLAVLDAGTPPDSADPLPLGKSRSLTVGDPVVAIGNPLRFERTATTGIVSAINRRICSPDDSNISNAIQTDAAINPGNSGGPLIDGQGRVIGINSQIVSQGGGFEGIGFAVAIDIVRPVAEAIIARGRAEHAWIGITGEPLTPKLAKDLGIPGTTGVVLHKTDPRGPAAKADLKASDADPPKGADVIVEIEGQPIRDFGDLSEEIGSRAVGTAVKIKVLRDGKTVGAELVLGDRPSDLGGTCQ